MSGYSQHFRSPMQGIDPCPEVPVLEEVHYSLSSNKSDIVNVCEALRTGSDSGHSV